MNRLCIGDDRYFSSANVSMTGDAKVKIFTKRKPRSPRNRHVAAAADKMKQVEGKKDDSEEVFVRALVTDRLLIVAHAYTYVYTRPASVLIFTDLRAYT